MSTTQHKYEFDTETMTVTYGGALIATLHASDHFPCAEDEAENEQWDKDQQALGEYIVEHLNHANAALSKIARG